MFIPQFFRASSHRWYAVLVRYAEYSIADHSIDIGWLRLMDGRRMMMTTAGMKRKKTHKVSRE
jgi:hypothetical protein